MKLITKEIAKKLSPLGDGSVENKPYLKLFNPMGSATWLISEFDGEDLMFGLCDLGMGCPELGYVSLSEVKSIKLPLGLGIERDIYWKPSKSLGAYADDARAKGGI
jgi:hypothetical protein|tara:strand:- start:1812 stop:2129 length:318 start_codon:yes stop_codon:yes gene_type:complete